MGGYPLDIPPDTGIPAWAYQDITPTGTWNDSLALPAATAAPESTYYGTPTASVIYRSGTPVIATGTAAAGSDGSPPSKNLAGPIAGGVIGGLALIAIIGALFWRYKRSRQTEDPIPMPTAYFPPGHEMEKGNWPPATPKPDGTDYPSIVDYGVSYPPPAPTHFSDRTKVMPTPKLYDPNDPSTFPKTPASFAYQSTTNYSQTTLTNQNDHTSPVGRYAGHPEF
ncbi:hypothetical protein FS837_001054 [Tulasnella sp. UAMH 9824]|nr:hypothetical protein FS837_001054 [Tulasnella sp. UAMH 9824]